MCAGRRLSNSVCCFGVFWCVLVCFGVFRRRRKRSDFNHQKKQEFLDTAIYILLDQKKIRSGPNPMESEMEMKHCRKFCRSIAGSCGPRQWRILSRKKLASVFALLPAYGLQYYYQPFPLWYNCQFLVLQMFFPALRHARPCSIS